MVKCDQITESMRCSLSSSIQGREQPDGSSHDGTVIAGESQRYIGTPNGVVVCVDYVEGYRFGGRFYHAYKREATEFRSMDELFFQLEKFYDFLNFPHPSTNERTFQEKKQNVDSGVRRTKIMKDEDLLNRHGDIGSFIIRVQHRQNSSWQGRLTWMEKDKTVYFRSVWEMIKLIASALDTVSEQDVVSKEFSWPEEGGEDTETLGESMES